MHRSPGSRSGRPIALAVLAVAVLLSACEGSNLFSLAASVGGLKPTVAITAPSQNLNVAAGAALQIKAEVTASNGLSTVEYSGIYTEGGTAAYVGEIDNFAGEGSASLDNTLEPVAGQETGGVWIIVKVTDGQGEAGADTVKITIS